jgi:hypothetical protein
MKNMNYDEMLAQQFSGLVINLVKHDTSPTGYPCYIEAHIGKTPKDKGEYAKDLSNYIPEYRGKGKTTTIRWFMSWENVAPIQENICKAFGKKMLAKDYLPFEFSSLIIQNKARGVIPKAA